MKQFNTFQAWFDYAKSQGFDVEINDATVDHIVIEASACKSGITWGEFTLARNSCESLEDYIAEMEAQS